VGTLVASTVYDILEKHGYLVNLRRLDQDSIEIRWPVNKLLHPDRESLWTIYRTTATGYFKQSPFWEGYQPVPGYALRPAIVFDMFVTAIMHDLPFGPYRSLNDESLRDMLPTPCDLKKEDLLFDLINDAKSEGFSEDFDQIAQQCDVWEGYQIIKGLLS